MNHERSKEFSKKATLKMLQLVSLKKCQNSLFTNRNETTTLWKGSRIVTNKNKTTALWKEIWFIRKRIELYRPIPSRMCLKTAWSFGPSGVMGEMVRYDKHQQSHWEYTTLETRGASEKTKLFDPLILSKLLLNGSLLDVLWCQPIKLIQVVSTLEFHENAGTTLILFFLSPPFTAGPQK